MAAIGGADIGRLGAKAVLTHGLNAVLPGSGYALNALGVFGKNEAPRDVRDFGGSPDTSKLQKITSVDPVGRSRFGSGPGDVRVTMDDGSSRIMKDIDVMASSGYLSMDKYYNPENDSMVLKPQDNGNWDFSGVDPRTGKGKPGQYGVEMRANAGQYGDGFGQYTSGDTNSPEATVAKPTTVQPQQPNQVAQNAQEPITSRNTSPVTGKRLGSAYLPNISYKSI